MHEIASHLQKATVGALQKTCAIHHSFLAFYMRGGEKKKKKPVSMIISPLPSPSHKLLSDSGALFSDLTSHADSRARDKHLCSASNVQM